MYQHNIEVRIKADKSPVTEADVRCETAIREIIEARFPSHGFYGEETGSHDVDAESLWLVDPIDGTKAFVREYPMFSTQIALMRSGEIVLGVSSAPVYGEVSFAERGRGAYLNGKPISVSRVSTIEAAALSSGNLKSLAGGASWTRYGALIAQVDRIRGYGDFLHYHLLAARKNRCRDRIRREYSRYCRMRGDRHRGGRPFHGFERSAPHAQFDHRAGQQWTHA